jgi:hypothetical protein
MTGRALAEQPRATSLKGFRDNTTDFSQGTAYAIDAMKANAVKRLVVLSALGVGESRNQVRHCQSLHLVDEAPRQCTSPLPR